MKNLIKISLVSSLWFVSSAFANSINLNLDAGAAFSQLSNGQYVSPLDGLENSYVAKENIQNGPFFGLGAEYNFDHLTTFPFTLGLGLSAYYIDLGNISGTETPGIDIGLTDTLNYQVEAQSFAVMFEPKLTYTAYRVQPYVLGGLGYAWNTLRDFSESAVPGSQDAPSDNPYGNHTEGSFAYELGAGIQYALLQNPNNAFFLRLEYRYLNLGQSELGATPVQTTNERLSINNTTANIIDFGLSYQFK